MAEYRRYSAESGVFVQDLAEYRIFKLASRALFWYSAGI